MRTLSGRVRLASKRVSCAAAYVRAQADRHAAAAAGLWCASASDTMWQSTPLAMLALYCCSALPSSLVLVEAVPVHHEIPWQRPPSNAADQARAKARDKAHARRQAALDKSSHPVRSLPLFDKMREYVATLPHCRMTADRKAGGGCHLPSHADLDANPGAHAHAGFSGEDHHSGEDPTGGRVWLKKVLLPEGLKVLWNARSVIPGTPDQQCVWTAYNGPEGGVQICVHQDQDLVSGAIMRDGVWGDCGALEQVWNDKADGQHEPGAIYLEVGTNIGACVLHMLMHTTANIVAFEPAPANLFCLSSTFLKLPAKYQVRVALMPVAAGSTDATSTIYAAHRNHGHSVVGRPVSDGGGHEGGTPNTFFDPLPIQVRRVDHILNPSTTTTVVMKLDVEVRESNMVQTPVRVFCPLLAAQWLQLPRRFG